MSHDTADANSSSEQNMPAKQPQFLSVLGTALGCFGTGVQVFAIFRSNRHSFTQSLEELSLFVCIASFVLGIAGLIIARKRPNADRVFAVLAILLGLVGFALSPFVVFPK